MSFVTGENVGPFRILEQLGQGGMATVFKAYHPGLDRYVALKALHPAFMEDPNFLARFQREAKVVAKLDHPNIVPIYDFAEHEGRPYLVMKYIEGETLKAHLSKNKLRMDEVRTIMEATGKALAYAHQQGILHRDVKPSNVLLAADSRVYLTDFGLARIAESGSSTLSSDVMIGTPHYISPEQALGKRDLDVGADIYSFGVVLYEMIVGRVPFSADTPFSIIHDHIYSPLPLPRTVNPEVSEGIERVLLKALAKDRADRFPDVASLMDAFEKASSPVEEAPLIEEPPAPGTASATMIEPDVTEMTPQPSDSQTVASTPSPVTLPPGISQKKQKPKWCLIIPLILILLGICLTGVLIGVRRWERISQSKITPTGGSALEVALQRVAENPNDPFAHFDLAMIYGDNKQANLAQAEFNRSLELAGEDVNFYKAAGDQLIAREAWLYAAQLYTQLAHVLPMMPAELKDKFHHSIFKAYKDPRAPEVLPLSDIITVDPLLAGVAQARHTLYHTGLARAQALVTGILKRQKDYPEARLVQAEINIKTKRFEEAKIILDEIIQAPDLPAWIKQEAKVILDSAKP